MRETFRVPAFTPDQPPKYLAVWYEDYRLAIETTTGKQGNQGFVLNGRDLTVYYREDLPIGLFHLTMKHVVDHISYILKLEAEYLTPPEERPLMKIQPYAGEGYNDTVIGCED